MYEEAFGLNIRPFREKVTGADVFVGPQTARTMAGFRKALAAQDAVVTVSGEAGTGKTTLVTRSVDAISVRKKIVRVGRMHMEASDVLESLLIVLGVEDRPAGAILRFTALRRKMKELQDAGIRVFVVVEDAIRTGAEVLAELEALTAADAGDSDGACIVLMGDERLAEFMKDPQLAQLQQRIRQRHRIAPLCVAELRGYLRHCFRLAGGDFDKAFDNKCCELLHHLGGGIPRLSNTIAESALTAAAEQNIQPVTAELVAKVAADDFALSADDFDFSVDTPSPVVEETPKLAPAPVAETTLELAPEAQPAPVLERQPESDPEPAPESAPEKGALAGELAALQSEFAADLEPGSQTGTANIPELTPNSDTTAEPVVAFSDKQAPARIANDMPELIQDTLPDLAILAPDLAGIDNDTEEDIPELIAQTAPQPIATEIPELEPAPLPDATPEPAPEALPELALEPEPVAAESSVEEIPEWDRDPTLAQLKPDLAALEQAMAFAHSGTDAETDVDSGDDETPVKEDEPAEAIPEITLDKSIRTGIENHLGDESETPVPAAPPAAPEEPRKADVELEKIAADLARAKTLEDVDDKMAETLFGSEISMIAAQVIGNPPADEPANDEVQQKPEPRPPVQPAPVPGAEEVSLETQPPVASSSFDLSASQRLKTVRALNADLHPSLREPENQKARAEEPPVSIEDQINTSITQTLKALKVPLPSDDDADEDKSGFFGRFRRS